MSGTETLALLCAGCCKYHAPLGSNPEAGKLSRVEVAGLLHGLSAEAVNLALAKYCADEDAERMLIAQVRVWAAGLAVKEQWPIVRGRPTVANMAALAVMEVVRPNRCGTCKGTCYKGARVCPRCNGVGVKRMTGVAIASACYLAQQEFSRSWLQRYEAILHKIMSFDSDVVVYVRKNSRHAEIA